MESARSLRKIVYIILIFTILTTIVCVTYVVFSGMYKEVLDKLMYSEHLAQESIVNVKSTDIPSKTYLYEILAIQLSTPASRENDLSSLVAQSSISDNENTVRFIPTGLLAGLVVGILALAMVTFRRFATWELTAIIVR